MGRAIGILSCLYPLLMSRLTESGGKPLETLIQTITRSSAGRLNVLDDH